MHIYEAKIKRIEERYGSIFCFYLERPDALSWDIGTNIQVGLPAFNQNPEVLDQGLIRRLSVMTLEDEGEIGFCTRIREPLSPFKRQLKEMQLGDSLYLFEPISRVRAIDDCSSLVLLSQGVGITSYRSLILDYLRSKNPHRPKELHLINVERENQILFTEIFQVEDRCYSAETVPSREAYFKLLKERTDLLSQSEIYIIGSDEFLHQSIAALRAIGISDEKMHLDKKPEKAEGFFKTCS